MKILNIINQTNLKTAAVVLLFFLTSINLFSQGEEILEARFTYVQGWTADNSYLFLNTSTGIDDNTDIKWDMGDGSVFFEDIESYQYSTVGEYTITLTLTNSLTGQIDSSQAPIIADPNDCTKPFAAYPTGTLGENEFVAFTAWSLIPFFDLTWDFGDGTTVSGSETTDLRVFHTYDNPDQTYTVTLTLNTSDCESTYSIDVTPNTQAPCFASFDYEPASEDGLTIDFINTSTSTEEGEFAYFWDMRLDSESIFGLDTATTENAQYTYFDNGDYNVSLTISNTETGCTDTQVKTITVDGNPPLRANFNYFYSSIVQGQEYTIVFLPNFTGDYDSFQIDFGDGTIITSFDDLNGGFTYDIGGIFEICATVSNSVSGESAEFCAPISVPYTGCNSYFIYENLPEENTFRFLPIFPSAPQPFLSYVWDFGDGTSPITTSEPYIDYTFSGDQSEYTVFLTTVREDIDGNPLCAGYWTETFEVALSLNDSNDPIGILNLYPNPNNGAFTLDIQSEISEVVQLKILDLSGRIQHVESVSIIQNQNQQIPIQLESMAKGVYLMVLEGDNIQLTKRFTIN